MSLFKKPGEPAGITFMLRGEPGSGKTWFGLSLKRATGKPVAYIGTDRGAKFYGKHPEVGGFLAVEARDAALIVSAVDELHEGAAEKFGGVVLDTVTDTFTAEQQKYLGSNGIVPLQKWKPLRDGHERLLRKIQALPLHVMLICEEKPIYERVDGDLKEIGTKEDADKRDAYACDVRLRFFLKDKRFFCEVLKDRTQTFPMGKIVENPKPEMWIKGAVEVPKGKPELAVVPASNGNGGTAAEDVEPALLASNMIEHVKKITNAPHMANWKKKHRDEVKALPLKLRNAVASAWQERYDELTATAPVGEPPPAPEEA